MKIFGIILLYLLIGVINFFGFFYVMCLKEDLSISDSFKEAIKDALIDTCKEFQTLELTDPSDIVMTVVIIGVWPIILGCGVIVTPCMLCVYGIKRIAKAILDKMTKSETKETKVSAKGEEFDKAVEKYKEYKKTRRPKPQKNTRSVRDPNYDPGEVTLKTSDVDNPSRKRIKKIKKVDVE